MTIIFDIVLHLEFFFFQTERVCGDGLLYGVSQEEKSIFWEVTVSVILSKKYICTCVLFRTVSEIELFHCTVPKLLIRKTYYLRFLIPVFTVQVTKLVQYT
jgi:hypothetical protein